MTARITYKEGPYVSFCVECDALFMGHQLATHCGKCAAALRAREAQESKQ